MNEEITMAPPAKEEPRVLQELRIFCRDTRDQKLNAGVDFNQAVFDEAVDLVIHRLHIKLGEVVK